MKVWLEIRELTAGEGLRGDFELWYCDEIGGEKFLGQYLTRDGAAAVAEQQARARGGALATWGLHDDSGRPGWSWHQG